jgi:hypothetical protein
MLILSTSTNANVAGNSILLYKAMESASETA